MMAIGMINRNGPLLLAFSLMGAICFSEGPAAIEPAYGLDGFNVTNAEIYGGIRGFELVPGAESQALLYLGGGYYKDAYYRDADGRRLSDPSWVFAGSKFGKWGLGVKLGLDLGMAYSEELDKNWLIGRLYARTRWQSFVDTGSDPLIVTGSGLADNRGFWETSLFAGLTVDLVKRDLFLQTANGIGAETSLEWAPGLELNRRFGSADYWRFAIRSRAYRTFLENERLSFYLAGLLLFDYLAGNQIPGLAQRSIGGFKHEAGLGGRVRGIEFGRYDGNVKLAGNLDLRMTFPTAIGHSIVPEIFVFFDAALVDDLDYRLRAVAEGLYSAGGGLYLNLRLLGFELDIGYWISCSLRENRWNFLNFNIGSHHF